MVKVTKKHMSRFGSHKTRTVLNDFSDPEAGPPVVSHDHAAGEKLALGSSMMQGLAGVCSESYYCRLD